MTERDGKTPSLVPAPGDIHPLRRFTDARVALGRAGTSLPTRAHLDFLQDHARARDAVWAIPDLDGLGSRLESAGMPVVRLRSAAPDRAVYLRRPDLGRRLADEDAGRLRGLAVPEGAGGRSRVGIVVADGLSAMAIDVNAAPVVLGLGQALRDQGLDVAPVALVEQGRVAIGDAIGEALGLALVIVLVGERPGLSAADSLGCYVTWAPRPGTPDSARNCVSNIRLGGLDPERAVASIATLVQGICQSRVSGVALAAAIGQRRE
ncbi:ethanolamine ammonia-lyase subunit EutC [Azospirillum brasilense]|uniref:Ethanolamine ammonia-lyase small subunit n=1 Tax=Azospirillum brasilense TaxID=192 RepID=A0A6L3B2F7_AZOBR|nr:ethanolamine ammonia-lyase subunit EutC [Azospirillum brasilense]KAA0684938.1 ethanolamine ammonia-lyase subunit EutC [Azospirillum brasilense]